ncbi:MAG TPA: septal ring lytic transglycosylase RlpA family protein [Clostridia bacterium]|nr:septal ring lytic transglycosylase RlpA family protein [Clostridia bacterium]
MGRVLTQFVMAVLLASTLGAAPGQKTSDSTAKGTSVHVKQVAKQKAAKPYQVGRASWYGKFFHGKATASGESYDMFRFTAAHPNLPLGTWVRVTNLSNDRSVIVRVNDRGPVVEGRIIDLSYGAAQILEFRRKGVERVRLDVVKEPDTFAQAQEVIGSH